MNTDSGNQIATRTGEVIEPNTASSFGRAATAEEEIAYLESNPQEGLLPPPDFKPFFILVEDGETREHYHPTIRYVFADDDPDDFTNVMLATIEQQAALDERQDAEERVAVIDMAADGKAVLSAASLSPHWQALNASVSQAPSWGEASQGLGRGLMLRISGREAASKSSSLAKKPTVNTDELIDTYSERLRWLDEILGEEQEDVVVNEPSIHDT
ncbi:hypothetical protein BAUCODRAFT_562484 [Baudoinia panamericana UAMH 10762]|uniref:Uncharacterized protein n=1 Tax=Baudoinia panamericana (strain UAMH 10762) TaxID=717646 RepID=M2ME09_BAUPA|nr:uncharacterized protein BAUCODRAFT_562484 [Baudoinia panamericana UAMH 10762]EMC94811.1 hypothetical protein BAUCODRAFT_562484 [Baudoinia panamericana UAMH 10762]